MDLKKMIESIIEDLANDAPISKIVLKAQTIAYFLDNEEFKLWIAHEQNGYENMAQVPNYRRVQCAVKLDISQPYRGILKNYYFPYGLISDKKIHDFIYTLPCTDSITEIENLSQGEKQKSVLFALPAIVWPEIEKCIEGNLVSAYQETTLASLSSIIDKMKSQLLQFFLELDKINIDFDILTQKETITQIMNHTINAGIVNVGNRNVKVEDSTIIGGENNYITISPQLKQAIENILKQIESIKSEVEADEQDIADVIFDIQNELSKSKPTNKILKRLLQALRGFGGIVAQKAIEYGLNDVLDQL